MLLYYIVLGKFKELSKNVFIKIKPDYKNFNEF